MSSKPKARRIRWRVRLCADGWLPVVLIGDEPWTLGAQAYKAAARKLARTRAAELRNAGGY